MRPAGAPAARAADPLLRGAAHARAGRWDKAASAFACATTRRPQQASAWLQLGEAQRQLGAFERGATAARRALALDPGLEAALAVAADCYERLGRHHDLVELFLSTGVDRLQDARLHLRLGIALSRLGRFEEAVRALFGALQRDKRCADAYAQLGNVFQLLKMPEEARESFRSALAFGRAPVEMTAAIVFTSLEAAHWDELAQDMARLDALVDQGLGSPCLFIA